MQYPHWLIVAGALLVAVGFIGLAVRKINAQLLEDDLSQPAPSDEQNHALPSDTEPTAKGK